MIRVLILSLLMGWGCCATASEAGCADVAWAGEDEVFYKIFVRSFADSDGDRIGDLRGIERNLPYLQQLGVTSLLLTPIVPSGYYHNYFATRFDAVDPAYGTLAAYRHLVQAVHARGMKIYLDQEIQYVDEDHPWWRDSAGRPDSAYSRHILYNEPGNRSAETGFLGTLQLHAYDGRPIRLAMLDLDEPAVRQYFQALFDFWIDPDADGHLDDGVDGFRIDHMMDDLDGRGKLTNLVAGFWAPLIAHARSRNPKIAFIAEQADWSSSGADLQQRGGIDMVYAFPLRRAIMESDPKVIAAALVATQSGTTAGKGQLIFVENHDTNRFASEVGEDPRKMRVGAALTVLLKGSPLLYYGQELGMRGKQLHLEGASDGNDIPVREAFRWQRKLESPGSAIWYRDRAPWWPARYGRDNDGVSVEEQDRQPSSLLNYYRHLLQLRRTRAELRTGAQCVLESGQPSMLAIRRESRDAATLMLVNLSGETREVVVPVAEGRGRDGLKLTDLITDRAAALLRNGQVEATVAGYGVVLLALPSRMNDLPRVATGTLERLPDFPSRHVQARNIDVWLPPGYDPARRHDVIYMHDGQMLFDASVTWNRQSWKLADVLGGLVSGGRVPPPIIVGIWNNGPLRHAEYYPEKFLASLAEPLKSRFVHEALAGKPLADRYLRFIVEELKPAIDARYATRPEREHTFIMGSSMGGLISLYAMSEYPAIFGGAACLSTHWPGTFEADASLPLAAFNYLRSHLPDPATHRLYMDHGTRDLDALYGVSQSFVDELVRERGYAKDNYVSRVYPGAGHTEQDWSERLDVPLSFLLARP